MVKIINNADDFGYSNAINYGIIDSYLNGMLTSTTLMPGMPGFVHAVELAKQNSRLGVGVHLTLTCGKPVLKGYKTLVDENGDFKKLSFYKDETTVVDEEEVYREWKAQIEKVYSAGIIPTHLDSHHHIHTFKSNPIIVKKIAKEYGLPVRNSFQDVSVLKDEGIITNDILIDPWCKISKEFETSDKKLELLMTSIKQQVEESAKTNDIIEVMWHPAYLDINIMTGSSFAYPRIYEVEAIQNQELIKCIKDNFELCTFQDIYKRREEK